MTIGGSPDSLTTGIAVRCVSAPPTSERTLNLTSELTKLALLAIIPIRSQVS